MRNITYGILLAEFALLAMVLGPTLFVLALEGDVYERFLAVPKGSPTSMLLQVGVGHPMSTRPYAAPEGNLSAGALTVLVFDWIEVVAPEAVVDGQGRVRETWVSAMGVDMGRTSGRRVGWYSLWWIAMGLPFVVPSRTRHWLALLPLLLAHGGLALSAAFTITLILRDPPRGRDQALLQGIAVVASCVLLGHMAAAWTMPTLLFHFVPVVVLTLGGLAVGLLLLRWCLR